MNPLLAGLINILPGAINTVGNIIKDKKSAKAETSKILPAFVEDKHNIADGLDISSKTVAGYGVGGVIVYYALTHAPVNLYILAIGALVVVGTTLAKAIQK